MAEMKAGECSPSNFNCPKFASIANQEASCLERIAFRSTDVDVDDLQLLGNRVSTNDLGLTGARVRIEALSPYKHLKFRGNRPQKSLSCQIGCL
jgi:hypothetical protein